MTLYPTKNNFYLLPLLLGTACTDDGSAIAGEDQPQSSGASVICGDAGSDADALPEIVMGDVTMAGPDCRPGSFTVVYDEHETAQGGHRNFTAYPRPHQVASTATRPYAESTCNFIVPVRVPAGWQYKLTQVEMRAEVDLTVGATGEIDLGYGFMGEPAAQLSNKRTLAGPLQHRSYEVSDAVHPTARDAVSGWSSCTDFRSLTLTTSLFLESPTPDGGAAEALDPSTTSKIRMTQVGPLKLALRRCQGAAAP